MLLRITSRYFVAGVVLDERGLVREAAPILGYMRGWDEAEVRLYAQKKGFSVWPPIRSVRERLGRDRTHHGHDGDPELLT